MSIAIIALGSTLPKEIINVGVDLAKIIKGKNRLRRVLNAMSAIRRIECNISGDNALSP